MNISTSGESQEAKDLQNSEIGDVKDMGQFNEANIDVEDNDNYNVLNSEQLKTIDSCYTLKETLETLNLSLPLLDLETCKDLLTEAYLKMNLLINNYSKELEEVIVKKDQIYTKFNATLARVAKWENEKDIVLKVMKKENEAFENNMISTIIQSIDSMETCKGVSEQIDLVLDSIISKIISKFSITIIPCDVFDPLKHAAVGSLEHGKNISKIIKKGYEYKGKVIRFAEVILD